MKTSGHDTVAKGKGVEEDDEEMDEDTGHAQQVVRELYARYRQQLERWRGYRDLAWIMGFVILLLAVLYTQRQAPTAHKVFQTLDEVLIPKTDHMSSSSDLYSWLRGVLRLVWDDPQCGDGLCEEPFEYPSYSQYGCRADCGKLTDNRTLTTIMIKLDHDFEHPRQAINSATLRQQASWNLCPVPDTDIKYSRECYYGEDHKFRQSKGSFSTVLSDVPNGNWSLVVRRDTFHKVGGSILEYDMVRAVSYYYRIYIGAAAAAAQQLTEARLLQQVHKLASTTYMEYVRTRELTNADEFRNFVTATCACWDVPVVGDDSGPSFNYSDPDPSDSSDSEAPYLLLPFKRSYQDVCNRTELEAKVCDAYNYSPEDRPNLGGTNWTNATMEDKKEWCGSILLGDGGRSDPRNIRWANEHYQAAKQLLVNKRLGVGQNNQGVRAAGQLMFDSLKNVVQSRLRELFVPIFQTPRGVLVLRDISNAKADLIFEQFTRGNTSDVGAAYDNITRATIDADEQAGTISLQDFAIRSTARIEEILRQRQQFLSQVVPAKEEYQQKGYDYPATIKVNDLVSIFAKALHLTLDSFKCQPEIGQPEYTAPCIELELNNNETVVLSNNTLPRADAKAFQENRVGSGGTLFTPYTIMEWLGGKDAYLFKNLAQRNYSQYEGQCEPMSVECVRVVSSFERPYNCSELDSGDTVPGIMADPEYRKTCEIPCNHKTDCDALCFCGVGGFQGTGCGQHERCVCDACTKSLNKDASDDPEFAKLVSSAQASLDTSQIADVDLNEGERRRLDVDEEISNMLQQTETLEDLQQDILDKMDTVTESVRQTNQIARERVEDDRLLDLVSAGKRDIESGQQRILDMLNRILGRQQESIEAAEAARAALNNIQEMANLQLQAQQALQARVQEQVATIQQNIDEGQISVLQALALYKRIRRDRLVDKKIINLANTPVTTLPRTDYKFILDNDNSPLPERARERYVGLTNRVIGGMLIHQLRAKDANCTDCSEFNKIQNSCPGRLSTDPYGVDPVFKRGSTLYNPDFDDINNEIVVDFYNCSEIENPTFNVRPAPEVATQGFAVTNEKPYCAELYNPRELPYGFHHFPLENKEPGFPVFLDINLSEQEAQAWVDYMEEGLYIDQDLTREVTVELITYNAPLRIISYILIGFKFNVGGLILVQHRMQTLRVELYNTYEDEVRYGFEIILSVWVFGWMLYNFWDIIRYQKDEGNMLKYFFDCWNLLEFACNGLLTSCCVIWWIFVTDHIHPFTVSLRHNVYADLQARARFLKLADGGEQMEEMWGDFHRLKELVAEMNWYFALMGVAILLLIVRVLHRMDFQPNLGVVTRSLWLAGSDLVHFAIIFFTVFIIYSVTAHLSFGHSIDKFATFDSSVSTCFEILLGNIGVNDQLRELPHEQRVFGGIFFWTYQILVFFVMLNFLLAIIVDAFSEVKEQTQEGAHVPMELLHLAKDKWNALRNALNPKYISDSKVEALLRQWAGEDRKKQQQATHERMILKVLNDEKMDEEQLHAVLMEVLRHLKPGPQSSQQQQLQDQIRSILCCMQPSRTPNRASRKDVKQAARFILNHFGEKEEVPGEKPPRKETWGGDAEKDAEHLQAIENEPVEYVGDQPSDEELPAEDEDAVTFAWEKCLPMWARRKIRQRRKRNLPMPPPPPEMDRLGSVALPPSALVDPELAALERERIEREEMVRDPDAAIARREANANVEKSKASSTAAREQERRSLKAAMERLATVQAALSESQDQLVADQARLAELMREIPDWQQRLGQPGEGQPGQQQ